MQRANWVPDRGEIIWLDANPESTSSIPDMQPLLVISPKKFNDRTGTLIGLPIASNSSHQSNPFAVAIHGMQHTISYVLAHQPKSLDWRLRSAKLHPLRKAPGDVMADVCHLLNQIVQLSDYC